MENSEAPRSPVRLAGSQPPKYRFRPTGVPAERQHSREHSDRLRIPGPSNTRFLAEGEGFRKLSSQRMDHAHIVEGGKEVFVDLEDLAELRLCFRFFAGGDEAIRKVRTDDHSERVLFASVFELLYGFLRPTHSQQVEETVRLAHIGRNRAASPC